MIPRPVLDRLGDRWSVVILTVVRGGPLRYTEILLRVPGISQKMLTQTLRWLETDGLVERTVFPTIPPRVDYRLTAHGRSLLGALEPLEDWARRVEQNDELRSA